MSQNLLSAAVVIGALRVKIRLLYESSYLIDIIVTYSLHIMNLGTAFLHAFLSSADFSKSVFKKKIFQDNPPFYVCAD